MIKDRGLELASFLTWFIRKEGIPPISQSSVLGKRPVGGVAFLAWSWGNTIAISLLAHAESLPAETREFLERYLRTYLIFDPPLMVFGEPQPPIDEVWHALYDITLSEQVPRIFGQWVCSYYTHDPAILSSIETISRAGLITGLNDIATTLPPPTGFTPEQLAELTDPDVLQRSHNLMKFADRSIYLNNAHELLHAQVWPDVRVVLIWCNMSVGATVYSAWVLAKRLEETWVEKPRQIEIKRMKGANHFPHWDNPEATLQFFAEAI